MKLTITRAELEEFPIVSWHAEFGSGTGEWRGHDFAEVGEEYDCSIGVVEPFIWGENLFLSSLCDRIIFTDGESISINGEFVGFILDPDEGEYNPHSNSGTPAEVFVYDDTIQFLSFDVPLDVLGKYVLLRASLALITPYSNYPGFMA